MIILKEYKQLTAEMAVLTSKIQSEERALNKLVAAHAPKAVGSIDYSRERVSGGLLVPDFADTINQISEHNEKLAAYKEELEVLKTQREKLFEVVDGLNDMHQRIVLLKIEGLSNAQIADKIGYSKRHIERLSREVRTILESLEEK